MKKVLQRGFKPAKCKTALQMANSRLKILKNKKEIQIKQLRRELAQLLESGQTPTARIRVEHVVREEKTVAAYELIGIYCELLVVRLGVIESQKNCPIDLKEAVTSVLFASQRLSDVPELSEIFKQFTTKYGKDFSTSAVELRPDSGVSRLLVEKLSAKAPDGPTKVKILMAIAEEHNVVWEAQSFVESDPKDTELLNGANSFQPASSMNMDSSINSNKEQPPNIHAPATVNAHHGSSERHHSPENSYANGGRSSSRSNNVTSGKADDYYHSKARPSRSRPDEGECRNPNHGYENSSSRNKQKWEPEFVDSTDAARAAAEAAERASFAARAAAELSNKERMTRQDSTQSHISSASVNLRNEPSHRRDRSNAQRESFSEDHVSPRRNVRMQYEDMDRTRQDRYDRAEQIPPVDQPSGRHSVDNSRNNGSFGREKQPSQDETDINVGYSEDVHLRKQSSRVSSHSHSSNYSDENDLGSDFMKSPSIVEENIFATEYDHQSQSSFKDIDSHDHGHDDDAAATDNYDDYSSFFYQPKFHAEDNHYQDEIDHGVGFSLLGSKTSASAASWSFKGDHSKSHGKHSSSSSQVFQENPSSRLFDDVSTSPPASYHEPDPHAKFDNYGPNSESDGDQPIDKVSGDVHERGNLTSDRSHKFKVSDSAGHEVFPLDTEEHTDNSRTREESDSDSEPQLGLRLGALAGGFRNKKTLPPYRMSSASSKAEKEYIQIDDFGQSSRKDLYSKKASNTETRPSFMPPHPSSSDEDDSDMQHPGRTETKSDSLYSHSRVNHDDSEEEKLPTRSSSRIQERSHKPSTGIRVQKRTNFKMPVSASSEDEEEVEREAARINAKPNKTTGYGFSLRTKGQSKANEKHSLPVTTKKTDKESHDQPSPRTVTSSHVPQTVKSPDPDTPSRERERASHVHPNLPEYDDIFARLGALRAPSRR
ncbi:Regulator of Vps4 activity in the MVB pathway protein [Arabidopsis thaliana]|jgi:vacuolar protein sorting-associated protein IST1|uniref:Regulator of Vps4 activity in the MVB pathway protein n=2 Tax=Arabidopsis thaliana TaxID=3702 RepID=F4ITF9_ARATH|nr:Regulator of Vps4 activity in the MVB pathway protein [Arabidopsis thaliana]AEC06916.1 Regulator of Vps4 activity in the MVB pathway protein [Arabidopsis thaliana]|eukprot:NP_179561.2 Regulator of Vps4 activity in the MVB pathway protein [Arabidopsis thaliana]